MIKTHLAPFRMFVAAAFAALLSTAAVAQTAPPTTAPASPSTPAAIAPRTPATAATPRAALPAGTKVNLNTASADQLDALPTIGKARTKVIMAERAKSPFKDWADFDKRTAHTSVNNGVKSKIKDMVTF